MILTLRDQKTEVDIDKLIELMNKTKRKKINIPMSSFSLMPITPIFPDTNGNYWRLIDILNYRTKNKFFKDHYKRMINADTKYPILLYGNKKDFEILDGHHRIGKQILDNEPTIDGVFVPKSILDKATI